MLFLSTGASLDLQANNGGIGVQDVIGTLRLETHNGGIHLANVGGDVQGETINGVVHVGLGGDHYEGAGMDVTTTNGGVHVRRGDALGSDRLN